MSDSGVNWIIGQLRAHGAETAIVHGDRTTSYVDLVEVLPEVGCLLDGRGIDAGSRCVLIGDFGSVTTALLLELIRRHAVIVPMTAATAKRRDVLFAICAAEWVIDASGDDRLEAVTIERLEGGAPGDALHPLLAELRSRDVPGLILFTSGSTGEPKAVVHDFSLLLEKYRTPGRPLRTVNFLLFDHWGGLNTLLHTLTSGGLVACPQTRQADHICDLIERHRLELLPASPSFLNLMLMSGAHTRHDLSSLRLVTYGAEPMPASTLRRLNRELPEVELRQTYGLIELGVLRTKSASSDSLLVKVGGDGYDVRVVDGMLEIKARSSMLGYLNAPAPFTDDGYFRTGDRVEVHGEYMRILGRESEQINVGGEKVFPTEVEAVLLDCPVVVDAVVYRGTAPAVRQGRVCGCRARRRWTRGCGGADRRPSLLQRAPGVVQGAYEDPLRRGSTDRGAAEAGARRASGDGRMSAASEPAGGTTATTAWADAAVSDALPRYVDAMLRARRLSDPAGDERPSLRIVLGGNANLDFLVPGLRVALAEEGFASEVTGSSYGNWITDTFDERPVDAWVVWLSAMGASAGGTVRGEVDVDAVATAVGRLTARGTRVIVIPPEPLLLEDDPFSPFLVWRRDLIERLTGSLPRAAVLLPVEHLVRRIGIDAWTATRYWEQAKAPCHPDGMTAVGADVASVLARLVRPRVKAIALDLDDTIWGGLVGEVGPGGLTLDPNGPGRAFLELQRLILDLTERGIAVGVVSKNDDAQARRPFTERTEMLLSLDTFVSFQASWGPKPEAIAKLAQQLNVGIDAICFLDDSPVEREAARQLLPGLIVPELPAAPEKRVPYLLRTRLFMAPVVSDEDRLRVAFYKRSTKPVPPGDLDGYLAGLDMVLEPIRVDGESFDRVLSLLHKTNQFNVTMWRPTPSELQALVDDDDAYAYAFRLRDRLGDAGIITALLARTDGDLGRVTAWVMSCRVFGRGVEWAVAEHLAAWLDERGLSRIEVPYVQGPRNGLVAEILPELGLAVESALGTDPCPLRRVSRLPTMASACARPSTTWQSHGDRPARDARPRAGCLPRHLRGPRVRAPAGDEDGRHRSVGLVQSHQPDAGPRDGVLDRIRPPGDGGAAVRGRNSGGHRASIGRRVAATMPISVVVGPADDERVRDFMALSATHYEGEPVNDERVVRWRHLGTPGGPSTTVELADGGDRVGRMWVQVHEWSVGGRIVRAANPIDFLIREDRRSLPTFLTLFKATMREAAARSDFVYHSSNPVTDDLYQKLAKLKPVTELDGAVLPIRGASLARAGGVVDLGPLGRVLDAGAALVARTMGRVARISGLSLHRRATPEEQDALVARLRRNEAVCGARAHAWREWRFRGAGPIAYERLWIRRRGHVVGCVVTSDRDLEGIRGRFVVDLVLPGGRPIWVVALWLQLAARAAVAGRDALFLFYNRANPRQAALAGLPLITVDRSRLPQRVPVFVRVARDDPADLAGIDWATGYYTLSDFDLF